MFAAIPGGLPLVLPGVSVFSARNSRTAQQPKPIAPSRRARTTGGGRDGAIVTLSLEELARAAVQDIRSESAAFAVPPSSLRSYPDHGVGNRRLHCRLQRRGSYSLPSLPYPDADRLVSVGMLSPSADNNEFLTAPAFLRLRERQTPFASMAAFAFINSCDLSEANPVRLRCAMVDAASSPLLASAPRPAASLRASRGRSQRAQCGAPELWLLDQPVRGRSRGRWELDPAGRPARDRHRRPAPRLRTVQSQSRRPVRPAALPSIRRDAPPRFRPLETRSECGTGALRAVSACLKRNEPACPHSTGLDCRWLFAASATARSGPCVPLPGPCSARSRWSSSWPASMSPT